MAGFRLPMCMKFAANVPLLSKTPNKIIEKNHPALSKALLNTLGSSIAFVIAVNALTIPGCSFKFILTPFPVTSLDNRSLRNSTLPKSR